jgi:DNA-binding response OmpR family regulator
MGGTHHSNRCLPPDSKAQPGDFDRSRIPRSKFWLFSSNLKQTPKEAKHEQELFTEQQFVRNGKPDRTQNPDFKARARSAIPRIADPCPHDTAGGPAPNGEGSSTAAVMKTPLTQFARASEEPSAEIFFDESLSRIPSMDLKEIQRLSHFLPVIVLISRSTAKNQVALRKTTLAKSSSESSAATTLLGIFGKAMERFKSTGGESTFVFGDVTVSFSAMEALRNGEPVLLTTMEFKTLRYLIQNARRVISRDELLNEVWGYENYPCTRTVDNHILRLRQKLERDPSRPAYFRTVRGAGYKFLP